MTLEQLANLGDFIGGIVVIVTLIFLVFEIRSNRKSINLSASIAWKESYTNLSALAASVPELADALKSYRPIKN
ncbi:MAG: hypothetical protein ACU84Q_14410 [Gammaproteobacteria bacterium]